MDITRRTHRDDSGFTMIEVLVITLIIGILSGIALPLFHSQAKKAHGATAAADLRVAATAMESYFADNQTYGSPAQLATSGLTPSISTGSVVVVVQRSGAAYCLAAYRNTSTVTSTATLQAEALRWFDSAAGGMQPKGATGCPTTTGYSGSWLSETISGP
jgi:type IV pilus assembly protein PilA